MKSKTVGSFSVKVNTTLPNERDSETKKRKNKGCQSILCFKTLLSQSVQCSISRKNHLTGPCGLVTVSDGEGMWVGGAGDQSSATQ